MKRILGPWIFRAAIIIAFVLVSPTAYGQETQTLKDPAALVNGVKITNNEYERELNLYLQQASQQGRQVPEFMMPKIKKEILDNLIDRELLFQESRKKNIDINTEQADQQFKKIKARFPSQAEFEKIIAQMKLSETDVKSQIKRNMAIRELIETQVTEKINITDEETKAYYDSNPDLFKKPEQVKASHILIKVDANATETQKAQARIELVKIQQKLKNGEDFAALAKEYSQGPSNVKGGDLGYFGRGQMVKPFENAAFALKPNEVSEIVETRFGYHLIKVVDKQPEKNMAYAEVKDQLNRSLKREKIQEGAELYINSLKKDANIEKFI